MLSFVLVSLVAFGQEAEPNSISKLLTDWEFWLYAIGGVITLLGFLQKYIPTTGKNKTIFDLVVKALQGLIWIIKRLIPDRKKGGGTHE